ncbi:NAD(P)H-binding protein [Microscilla marina]|uniref:Oxidoreductase n=1 Tax=Microscilla marina ATCC 23134 TaxID=313606 RepID=A1ZHR4_MICM2|nr:NAD(P)H-binding protein [Microscilla marina]EAY30071.1 oxidoreductase [Microscilla marina ATCC 23134]
MNKIAIVAGATGLVGSELVKLLLQDDDYQQVKIIGRKSIGIDHAKIEELLVDFDQLDNYQDFFVGATEAFCCLGTTTKKMGKEGLTKVDFTYCHAFAQLAAKANVAQFLIISSIGASADSRYHYSRVKARIEDAVKKLPFKSIHILRPSLLVGDRNEVRILEDLGRVFSAAFNSFIPAKYKSIKVKTVAVFMQKIAKKQLPGQFTYESNHIRKIAVSKFDYEKFSEYTEYKDL